MMPATFKSTTPDLPMQTVAFKMKLKPGNEAEYEKRHNEIWPELVTALHEAGISDYSIFLDAETLTLFAVQKQSDAEKPLELPKHPAVRKWWEHMAPLMEVHPDSSPVCTPLHQVFHLP